MWRREAAPVVAVVAASAALLLVVRELRALYNRILNHHHLYAGRRSPSNGHGDGMSFIFCSNLAHIIKFKITNNRKLTTS